MSLKPESRKKNWLDKKDLLNCLTFQIGFALTIEAEDKGIPPMKSQVTLAINVVDVNDNPPIFKKRKYQGFMNNDLTNLRNDLQVSIKITNIKY